MGKGKGGGHSSDAADIPKSHLDDPQGTGCVWRWTRDKHNADCCDHTKQSYSACKGRAPYVSGEYLARWEATHLKRKIYEDKLKQKQARVAEVLKDKKASRGLRDWAENFDSDKWLEKKRAMLGDAFHRLEVKESPAWQVGVKVTLTDEQAKRYFGRVQRRSPQENHKPRRDGGLGGWYPYDHEHHHILPISSVAAILSPAKEAAGTKEDRLEIIKLSQWNINCEGNVMILPIDVNVSRIVRLPAHCPWGGWHQPYLDQVKKELGPVRDALDAACKKKEQAKKDQKHEALEEGAANVAPLLRRAQKAMYDSIVAKGGGTALGKV
jgi:hypothetical protein